MNELLRGWSCVRAASETCLGLGSRMYGQRRAAEARVREGRKQLDVLLRGGAISQNAACVEHLVDQQHV